MPQIRAATTKALELDDTLGEVYLAAANLSFWWDWDWAATEREFKRALELEPAHVGAHSFYALFLAATGRNEEAVAEALKAQQLEPLSVRVKVQAGWVFLSAQDYDRALETGRQAIAMAPDFFFAHKLTGSSLFVKGQLAEGIAEMETAARLSSSWGVLASLGGMYARVGRKADTQRILDQALAQAKQQYVPAHAIANLFNSLGEFEQANVWMNKAIEDREGTVVFLTATADDITRANPHYAEWLKKIGLDK